MEILPIVFSVVVVVLGVVLTVVGIQLILVLWEARRALQRLNTVLTELEHRFQSIIGPLQNLGGMANGLKTGLKVFETFVGWLQKEKSK